MTLSTDMAGDYAYLDGLEAVTLIKPGSTASTSVASALRRAVSVREAAASGGRYTTSDLVWHLPQSLVTTQPALGDKVRDAASVDYTILEVHKETLGTRWKCITRDLAVAHRLDTLVTIERGDTVKGVGGAAEPVWDVWLAGVRARIQPIEGRTEVENQQRIDRATHTVFVDAADFRPDHRSRVKDESGAVYAVIGYRQPAAIGRLLELDVVAAPWPFG